MKFRNATSDRLEVPSLGFAVEPGAATPELGDEAAAGFVLQAAVWVAVGADAKQEQKAAAAAVVASEGEAS